MKMNELVSFLQLEYPELVQDMREANHHLTVRDQSALENGELIAFFEKNREFPLNLNPYHLEGTVWEHVLLVCKQAENASYEVQIAALLHDIGKPSTRAVNPKNGRVSFFNHDAVSAFMSLEILKRPELNLSKEQQILIFRMIALHTQVYKLTPKQLADIGDMNLIRNLIELGRCDHEGRFHSHEGVEIPTFEEVLHEFEYPRERVTDKEAVVLCGLPSSGKSTWKIDNQKKEQTWISRDSIIEVIGKGESYNEKWKSVNQKEVDKRLQGQFKAIKESLPHKSVIVDMTHMSKKSRRKSLSHFGPEYKKKCVVFLTDLETLFLRNEKRTGKTIDRRVIERMMKSFYLPTLEEFDEIEYIIS